MKRTVVKAHKRGGRYVRSHGRTYAGNQINTVGGPNDTVNSMWRAYGGIGGKNGETGAQWMGNRPVRQTDYYKMLQAWESRKQTRKAKAINNSRTQTIKQIGTPDSFSESA